MSSKASIKTAILACIAFGFSGVSQAQPYTVEGHQLELPAPPTGHLTSGDRLFVSIGQSGVAIFDVSQGTPQLLEIRSMDGRAEGIITLQDAPWVLLSKTQALPLLDTQAHSMLGSETVSPSTPGHIENARRGQVVTVSGGSAVIDQGQTDGLEPGDGIRFVTRIPVAMDGLEAAEGDALYKEVEVAVGEVTVVGNERSQVTLRRGGRTAAGDFFEPISDDDWRSDGRNNRLAPKRLGNVNELSFSVRPFLAVGTLGVGSVSEVSVSHTFSNPAFIEARIQPLTLGWSREGNLVGLTTLVLGGYDNPFFAIGMGLGMTAANTGVTGVAERFSYSGDTALESGGRSSEFVNVNKGFSLGQVVRLGARDGLNVEVRNTFVLGQVDVYESNSYYDDNGNWVEEDATLIDSYKEFRWGSTNAKITIPVADLTDLYTDIGGGATGYFNVSGGVQSWVRGNGDVGSLNLSAAAGYGYMAGRPEDDYIELQGPLFSFGARYRF